VKKEGEERGGGERGWELERVWKDREEVLPNLF
jgi:hypothetical protein